MSGLARDLRYAFRRLLTRPGFTAVIVFSLAVGIGSNAVIFSIAKGLLRGATPYPDPDRVLVVWFTPPDSPGGRILATPANCAALRDRARSFQHLGCALPERATTLGSVHEGASASAALRLVGQEFTAGTAEALGVPLLLGRWFTREEERRGDPIVVISERLWRTHFSAAPDVIGRQVRATNQGLTGEVATIVGVAPSAFQLFDGRTDYWLPLTTPRAALASPARQLIVVGRMKAGVTRHQVQSEMTSIAIALESETPATNKGWGIRPETVRETLEAGLGRPLSILQGVVALVLLIACGNVAGLLLGEGVSRRNEMAVRAALGAGRWRIIRQCLAESVVISVLGAMLGLAFAWAGLRILVASLPPQIPGLETVSLDLTVLIFTGGVSVFTALACGIVPAVRASRARVTDVTRRWAPGRGSAHRLRSGFVVGQIALAVLLSVVAALMLQSLRRLSAADIGVDPADLTTFQIQLDGRNYIRNTGNNTPSGAMETELTPGLFIATHQIRDRLAGMPGIKAATAMAAVPPVSGFARAYRFVAQGSRKFGPDQQPAAADWFPVLPRYFTTVGIAVRQGRDLEASDTPASLPVAVINETMAREAWPGDDPLGRTIQLGLFNDPPRKVVGVVADVRQSTRRTGPLRQVYVPFGQLRPIQSGVVAHGLERVTFVVRSSRDASALSWAFHQAVAEVDPALAVTNIKPLDQYVRDQLGGFRQYAVLLTVFAAAAVVLAAVGAYALMAHSVEQRINEIGIRMALGATGGQTLRLILGRGIALSATGLVLGSAGAVAASRVLESFLWEVTATDPATFSSVAAVLGGVSTLACYIAARRALTLDPAVAIRHE